MFVAALIVLVVAVLLVLAAVFGGSDSATLDMGVFDLQANAMAIFFLGMFTLLLFVLSLGMLRSGAKRARARRADRKQVGELSEKLAAYHRDETTPETERDQGQ